MELEFDKEIDAILRKGAREPAPAGSLKSAHLEADAIAAFAENALPASARSYYTGHLADCDRCRSILAQTISLHTEADMQAASSAVKTGAVTTIAIPWYRKLFAIPNLAMSAGALFVIVFAGLLGYIALQRNAGTVSSDVSKLNKPDLAANRPASAPESSAASSSNSAANTTASNSEPLNSSGPSVRETQIGQETPEQPGYAEKLPADEAKRADNEDTPESVRSAATPPPQPVLSKPLLKEETPKTEIDDKKAVEKRAETKQDNKLVLDGVDAVTGARREVSKDGTLAQNKIQSQNNAGGLAKSKSGPYVNRDQQINSQNSSELPVNGRNITQMPNASGSAADTTVNAPRKKPSGGKNVGGRSFEKKNGVWYDTAYHGQSTIDIRRGSGEYKTLDSGLRSIAESLRGTVVVVWGGRAYRIQ